MVLHPFHTEMHSAPSDVLLVKVARAIGNIETEGTFDAATRQWLVPMVEWSALLEARKAAKLHKGHRPEDVDWLKRLETLTNTIDLRDAFDVKRQCVRVPQATGRSLTALVDELQEREYRESFRRTWIIETMIEMGIKPEPDAYAVRTVQDTSSKEVRPHAEGDQQGRIPE